MPDPLSPSDVQPTPVGTGSARTPATPDQASAQQTQVNALRNQPQNPQPPSQTNQLPQSGAVVTPSSSGVPSQPQSQTPQRSGTGTQANAAQPLTQNQSPPQKYKPATVSSPQATDPAAVLPSQSKPPLDTPEYTPDAGESVGEESMTYHYLSIGALVLGVLNLCSWFIPLCGFPMSIVGIVLGIIGLKSPKGKTMAIIAIVLSVIGIVLTVVNGFLGMAMSLTGDTTY